MYFCTPHYYWEYRLVIELENIGGENMWYGLGIAGFCLGTAGGKNDSSSGQHIH